MTTQTTRPVAALTNDEDGAHIPMTVHRFVQSLVANHANVRVRAMKNTQGATLCPFVEKFTKADATIYTDEYNSYNQLQRIRHTVCHSQNKWARDDDGEGIREVHVNSNEGGWAGLRNFLRPFRGVHKKYLSGHVAIPENELEFYIRSSIGHYLLTIT